MRTFLTLLGVMIGTASIILMMSLGLATDAQFNELMEGRAGDMTTIEVRYAGGWFRPPPSGDDNESPTVIPELDDNAIVMFNRMPGVLVASPIVRNWLPMRSGNYVMHHVQITGVNPEALALMGYELAYGRIMEPDEQFAVVFGGLTELAFQGMDDEWWENRQNRFWNFEPLEDIEQFVDVINDPIQLSYDHRLTQGGNEVMDFEDAFRPITVFDLDVVGVLSWEGAGPFTISNSDIGIYMNIETVHMLNRLQREFWNSPDDDDDGVISAVRNPDPELESFEEAFVRVESIEYTSQVAAAINDMGFHAWYPGGWIEDMRQQQQGIRTLLTAIAAISLLVAAINIANTMITSVTERTKEIGVMKVIGAALKDVRRLFLLEAVVIGTLGGIFGVGISLIGSYAMNNFEIAFLESLTQGNWWAAQDAAVSLITPWLVGVALGVAAVIGLISGYYPARYATKLSALAAIRSD